MLYNRRREARLVRPGTVSYSFSANNGYRACDIPAIQLNVSPSGMGILAARPLAEGLVVLFDGNGSNSHSRATVVWCRREGKFLFKVGLALN